MTRHLLVIGAQRCGTTYLMSLLDSHPEITAARPARPEPKVFCSPDSVVRGADWYRRTYFSQATAGQVLAEKSTSYLESPAAAEHASTVLGAVDILALLRDPVARAVSNWRLSTRYGFEDRPVATALEENLAGPRPWDPAVTSVSPYAYVERGRYVDYLDPWLAAFPDTVRVRFLEDLVSQASAIGELYASLGVDRSHRPPDTRQRVNASDGNPPDLPGPLLRRLREFFRDSDARLAALVGRDVTWPER